MKQQTPITKILSLIIFLFISHSLFSQIITVKQDGTGDFTTIQEGINASIDGDTVLVYPGTYYENIAYNGKEITLASLYLATMDKSYINNTIIDGNQNGSCVRIASGEDETTVLCGFTIQNGSGFGNNRKGGGLYTKNSKPKIISNIIKNNFSRYGGGIYCEYSELYLSGNSIIYNHSIRFGGGINITIDAIVYFDTINKNNIYLNYSGKGSDIRKSSFSTAMHVVVDTFTVLNPDNHFVFSSDLNGFPVNDITLDIENCKIETLNNDLYVNPLIGNNSNTGLSPEQPLKTIALAYKKIASDSLHPNKIFLSNGTYALSLNNEMFPLNARSYVSLHGNDKDSTILDAESLTLFMMSNNLTRNYEIRNISFKNGFGNHYSSVGSEGGIFINYNKNLKLDRIHVSNTIGSSNPGIIALSSPNINLRNLQLKDNKGNHPLYLGCSLDTTSHFYIENCIVSNNWPDSNPETGEGGGVLIGGSLITPDTYSGEIINLQITENLRVPDPLWGSGMTVGLLVGNHAKVDLINSTIGNNVLRGVQGYAVQVNEGAELNIYNSIFYGDSLRELSLGSASGSSYPVTANVCYSNIEGGEAGVKKWQSNHTLNWLDGNINEDPLWDTASAFPYSLQRDSPCINAGTPMYKAGMEPPFIFGTDDTSYYLLTLNYNDTILLPSTDLAGNARISGGRIDMGAYEFDTTAGINDFYPQNTNDNKIIVYPNPFYYHTFIAFKLLHGGNVKVIIYDINGKKVKSLMNAKVSKGEFTITWEGNNDQNQIVKQGTYIATIIINGKKEGGVKILKRK